MADAAPATGLTLLLCALAGRPGRVQWAPPSDTSETPRPARAVIDDGHVLMPGSLAPGLHAAAIAHAAAHWLFSIPHRPAAGLTPISRIVIGSIEDARAEHLLAERLPGVARWFQAALAQHRPEGLGFADLLARMSRVLWLPDAMDLNPWVQKAREKVQQVVAAHGWHDAAALRQVAAVLANDLGQMRVRLDPGTYVEPTPYRDDNSWLWQHAATSSEAQALDASGPAGRPPPGDALPVPTHQRVWHYPEWDHRTHHLRADWCTVMEQLPAHARAATAPQPSMPTHAPLHLPQARSARVRLRRQAAGDVLDIEACVRFVSDRQQGAVHEPRVFQRQLRRSVPAAVLVLMDLSASTGDALPGGATMLALEQAAALLLARATAQPRRRLAVHGFSSDTRHAVRYLRLLDFGDEPAQAESRLQGIAPQHSTRLGAALRHAAARLAAQPAEQRLLLVLTDGAPSDIDVADARYLVEDARHAALAARRRGIETACLATDPAAEDALVRMFGRRFTRIAQNPRQLPAQLLALFQHLAR